MRVREQLILSDLDASRLRAIARHLDNGSGPTSEDLYHLLDLAEVVPVTDVQPDLVTMRSTIVFDDGKGGPVTTMTLVYPEEADVAAGRLSVLSPLGFALLGARAGDAVEYQTPDGTLRRAHVREVLYQPEASGDLLR